MYWALISFAWTPSNSKPQGKACENWGGWQDGLMVSSSVLVLDPTAKLPFLYHRDEPFHRPDHLTNTFPYPPAAKPSFPPPTVTSPSTSAPRPRFYPASLPPLSYLRLFLSISTSSCNRLLRSFYSRLRAYLGGHGELR